MSYAKIILLGNLGKDPELRYTETTRGEQAVCDFSVAVNSKVKEGGEYVEKVAWYNVTVWGKQAEACAKFLTKGSGVYVEGRPEVQIWTDRENEKRFTNKVTATEVQFIGGGGKREEGDEYAGEAPAPAQQAAPTTTGGADDDIPF